MVFQEFIKVCPKCGKDDFYLKEAGHFMHKEIFKCRICGKESHDPEEVRQLTTASTRAEKTNHTSTQKRGLLDNLLNPQTPKPHTHRRKGNRRGWV